MFDAISRFEPPIGPEMQAASLDRLRVNGGVELRLDLRDGDLRDGDLRGGDLRAGDLRNGDLRSGRTVLASQCERDGYKLRLPKRADILEIAVINTGGGIAGGDRIGIRATAGPGTSTVVATPAAERVYAAHSSEPARYDLRLELGCDAALDWLPQETILYDRARLHRSISVEMARSARLLIAETVIFGRIARGETLGDVQLADDWRIRRDGRLILADSLRLSGNLEAILARPAIAARNRVVSTLLFVATDAAELLPAVRRQLAATECGTVIAGASSWDDILMVRLLAPTGQAMRGAIERVLTIVSGRPLPRVWNC